jgi:diguanylate cyclase (GGDEF)-like protein/PAS domain S-box-containing protein
MSIPRYVRLVLFAALTIGAAIYLGSIGWPQPDRVREFAGLTLAAIVMSAFAMSSSTAEDRGMMTPPFAVEFTALLIVGGNAALVIAAVGIVTRWLADWERARPLRRMLVNAASVMIATEAAALAHAALGGTTAHFTWPAQGLPIVAAVAACTLVKTTLAEVIAPLLNRQTIDRAWPNSVLRNLPNYLIGASVAVGVVEILDHGAWQVLPVAAIPLYCAYRAYCSDLKRAEHEYRRREVIDSINQGMSVIDSGGKVTLWNDSLERITGCPRERALGRSLVGAVAALNQTQLPKALDEALASRTARTLTHVHLPSATSARTFEVKILPVSDGVTLLWHDVTERIQEEQALKRSEERLALAAEGANDGLWEWDLRTQAFYVSGRWKAMIGLPATAAIARVEDWLTRVHAEDVAPLKQALEAHFAGKTEYFEHEHRLRHEDGTYRRFLCRGVAARRASQRAARIAGSITDTTDQASAQEQLRTAAFRDPLTGLCNRALFVERLGRRLADFKRQRGSDGFAALYLDLDRFKVVNDSLGHMVGDELLTATARRLESCLRQGDALARLGGDEFAILLNSIGDPQQANAVAFRIQKALSDPFSIGGREVFTSASIGIAFGLAHYDNPEEIMRDADTAMYHAKSRGKARHELFDAASGSRTICATPSTTTTSRCITSRSCCSRRGCASVSSR